MHIVRSGLVEYYNLTFDSCYSALGGGGVTLSSGDGAVNGLSCTNCWTNGKLRLCSLTIHLISLYLSLYLSIYPIYLSISLYYIYLSISLLSYQLL